MTEVAIGIGSNIEPERHVRAALEQLEAHFSSLQVSPIYRCPAVGFAGADFVNLVAIVETDNDIHTVQADLRKVEQIAGRDRTEGNESRTLDLDMLLFGDQQFNNGDIRVPRDDILKYAFVLRPLVELWPARRHPTDGRTYRQLWHAFEAADEQPLTPIRL